MAGGLAQASQRVHAQAGGVLDTSFRQTTINGSVYWSAVQPADGKVVVGGTFSLPSNGITRLNADGSLDTGFNQEGAGAGGGVVEYVGLQSDRKILVAGNFQTFNTTSCQGLVRLNSDGTVDSAFNCRLTGTNGRNLFDAALYERFGTVLTSSRLVTGYTYGGVTRPVSTNILRLNSDGSLAMNWDSTAALPLTSGNSYSILLQPQDRVLVLGNFNTSSSPPAARNYLVRLDVNGNLDQSFNPGGAGPNGTPYEAALQPDGRMVLVGSFNQYNGASHAGIVRLNADGTPDASFNASINGTAYSVAVQADNRIVISGSFTQVNGVPRSNVAQLNPDGTLDTANFANVSTNALTALFPQPDGRLLISEAFTQVNGDSNYQYLARLFGDPASLQFASASANVAENAGSVSLTVNRLYFGSGAVSVYFATADGSAKAGVDYRTVSGTLSWADGDVAPKTISVPIIDRHLSSGSANFFVNLSSPGGRATLGAPSQASLTILETDQPPVATIQEVDLLSPPSDITVVQGQQIDLYGSVTATVNTLHGEFFALDANQANARSLGTFDNQVFNRSPNWTPALGDSYLRLTVTDTSSNTSASTTHPIHVLAPAQVGATPQANLLGGLDGRTVALNDTVTVVAEAIDSDGNPLQNAQFYLDGVPITTSTVASGQSGIQTASKTTTAQSGTLLQAQVSASKSQQLITVVGTKANGVSAVSNGANLYSKSGSGQPPTCAINNVSNGASVTAGSAGQNVNVTANAGSAPVTKVELFVDRQSAGTLTAAPFNFALPVINRGVHALSAISTDSNGVAKVSSSVIVTAVDPPTGHPAFFNGEVSLGQGVYYLAFPANGNIFGYYEYLSDPHFVYHFDMGFEYWFDSGDGSGGIYFYDFTSSDFLYTSPTFGFPYLYDFGLQAFLYYYPDPTNSQRYNTNGVRYFFNFSTGKVISK